MVVAVFSSLGMLAVAFLLRFLFALRNDSATITVAPHLRVVQTPHERSEPMPKSQSAMTAR